MGLGRSFPSYVVVARWDVLCVSLYWGIPSSKAIYLPVAYVVSYSRAMEGLG